MQSQSVYKLEAQCRASIDNQKKYMFEVANQAGQPKMTILEGTCVNTKINTPSKQI
jgi:sugar phosphate isomerase/epimerase